jgi:hypothetical protein
MELGRLREVANGMGAEIETNILSQSLFFFKDSDIASMWPEAAETSEIVRFVGDELKRPSYEVKYIDRYYRRDKLTEPPRVLGFLQVFVLSNGDVLTGCYPLPPVGNILKQSLQSILSSEAYYKQSLAMVRRECPGCTCGVESSLAMKYAASSGIHELGQLVSGLDGRKREEQRSQPRSRIAMKSVSGV